MEAPFVSVVVPTHNRCNELAACLEHLVAQDYSADAFEVIVADDGSTDDTAEVARRFASVRLVSLERGGSNAARNAGIAASSGDPVCFIDDDVRVRPSWLRAIVDGAARHPDADALAGRVVLRFEGRAPRCAVHPLASQFDWGDDDHDVGQAIGANMAIRRSAFDRVGQFDDWIWIGGADTEWFDRLNAAGGRTIYVADALAEHWAHVGGLGAPGSVREAFRRGVAMHRYRIRLGRRNRRLPAFRSNARLLTHALRHRCPAALSGVLRDVGLSYGTFRYRSVAEPPRPGPSER